MNLKEDIKTIVVLSFSIFGATWLLIEPLLGLPKLGYYLLLVLSSLVISIFITIVKQKMFKSKFPFLKSISTGEGRDRIFFDIRNKAKKRIFVMGIGMNDFALKSKDSIFEQARKGVHVSILMMDPEFLENNSELDDILGQFLGFPNYKTRVRNSFTEIKKFCEEWNQSNPNRMKMKVYKSIPTCSLVMIDWENSEEAELVIEFFLYKCGEQRLRLEVVRKSENRQDLFTSIRNKALNLWENSRIIVQ